MVHRHRSHGALTGWPLKWVLHRQMQIQFRRPYHGQSQRDPSAQTSGTHKPGDRTCCWLRPQHGHTHISPCSGAAAWLGSKRSPCRSRKFPSGYFQPSKRTLSTRCRTTKWVHREMQKSGVTLSLLWVEYCEQCRQSGELPYKSTQFNKYYADYVHKTKATMHLEHKPGETMQVDWAGQTAALVDTDTGERLDAYLFVAVAAIQRLRLHRGLPGHEAGGLDHRPCQRLPVFRRRHPHPHAGQPQDRCTQELPDGNSTQQVLPGDGRALRHRHSPGSSPQP